jgi:hypothetical protein
LPLRSAFLSTLKPFLEVVGDPFVRFHFAFKGSDIFYMAVRPLGRDVPNVVHGVRYLQGWNFGRRLGRHGVFANSSFNAPGLHGLSDVSGNRALPRVLEFSNAEALSSVPALSRTAPSSVRQRTVEGRRSAARRSMQCLGAS